jgi:predicted lipase
MMTTKEMWKWETKGPWITEPKTDTQWKHKVEEDILYICFQGSISRLDWIQNFMFWKKPYRNMKKIWFAHAGFVKKWKAIEKSVQEVIEENRISIKKIVGFGFSQGAALNVLFHEWVVFNYPDISINSISVGCPRVIGFFGEVDERFKSFERYSIKTDIVTHAPFAWLGYRHVGKNTSFKSNYRFWKIYKNHLSYEEHL